MTGEVTTTAVTGGYGDKDFVIRQIGKKLECFIETDEFLETLETMETGVSSVAYKFDDGPVVRQGWSMSKDNTVLFNPGCPVEFLNKMQNAKRLAIEFNPADKVAQTKTFNVSQLSSAFVQQAALIQRMSPRAVASRNVYPCKIHDSGDWCWSYGDGQGQSIWNTKEEAIESYIEAHSK